MVVFLCLSFNVALRLFQGVTQSSPHDSSDKLQQTLAECRRKLVLKMDACTLTHIFMGSLLSFLPKKNEEQPSCMDFLLVF